jgi:microcystin degradation protein MlrC
MQNNQTTNNNRKFRVALAGIYHESNTFIDVPTTIDDFKNSHYLRHEEIIREYAGAYHEISGMIEVCEQHDVDLVPLIFAEATPGGMISTIAYQILLNKMITTVQNALPVDAILVVPHGAGVADCYPDMDGHWLSSLREIVGPDIPIVGTLDPHANASHKMIAATTALIAYSTNPHIDQRETGRKAARLLVQILNKEVQVFQTLTQTSLAISIEQQHTFSEPCKSLYELANNISKENGIYSVSILLGFPYADVREMGTSFIVVADTAINSTAAGDRLRSYIEKNRQEFVGLKEKISTILSKLDKVEKPALLLDMGDNIGGGSAGNSAYLLNALEDFNTFRCFICIYDPRAAEKAANHELSEEFYLTIGNHDDESGVQLFSGTVRLIKIADGKFSENNPRHGGQVNFNMGLTAIVETKRGNTIMINSLRVPPFSLSQLTTFGIQPSAFDVVVAKGVNAPIAAYKSVCPTIIQVNTPGVTQADMTLFHFKNRRKPLFPFENNF